MHRGCYFIVLFCGNQIWNARKPDFCFRSAEGGDQQSGEPEEQNQHRESAQTVAERGAEDRFAGDFPFLLPVRPVGDPVSQKQKDRHEFRRNDQGGMQTEQQPM